MNGHFVYSSTETRTIKLPGEPAKTYRQSVQVKNGSGKKVVEQLSNGRVVARNTTPIEDSHMAMIANRQFVPGLFRENYSNLGAGNTRRRKTGRKTRRR
jgi:hypothetical protein